MALPSCLSLQGLVDLLPLVLRDVLGAELCQAVPNPETNKNRFRRSAQLGGAVLGD
jgi:hypothetical protein